MAEVLDAVTAVISMEAMLTLSFNSQAVRPTSNPGRDHV